MLIRAEQMTVFELTAEDNFARRIAKHLLENYAESIVRLPESIESTVAELPEERLRSLVKVSIERARSYNLTFESSIAAFSALMFEVAPNFDSHRLVNILLNDEHLGPETRLDELLKVLTEKNWETIRGEYDETMWLSETAGAEHPKAEENSDDEKTPEFVETVMNVENAGEPAEQSAKAADFDFLDTVPNIGAGKE